MSNAARVYNRWAPNLVIIELDAPDVELHVYWCGARLCAVWLDDRGRALRAARVGSC